MPDTRALRWRQLIEKRGRGIVAAVIGVGFVLLIVAITAATLNLRSVSAETDGVQRTLARQAALNRLATFNERIENGRRGFLLQPNPVFIGVIRESTSGFDRELAAMKELFDSDLEASETIATIEQLQAERTRAVDATLAEPGRTGQRNVPDAGNPAASERDDPFPAADAEDLFTFGDEDEAEAGILPGSGSPAVPATSEAAATGLDLDNDPAVVTLREIRTLVTALADEQREELVRRNRSQFDSLLQFYVVGGIAILLLLALMGTVIVLVMRYNRDLTAAQSGLRRANETLESTVTSRTAELMRANEEIQRFAYIVSHDLRSPLVNVLGFTAELDEARKVIHDFLERLFADQPDLREEQVWLAVDEDLPEALGFIRTSTEKMDRLINSILELSRQGRRTMKPEELDMEALVGTIVATLQQSIDEAGATVTINRIPNLEGDRIAVEQILQNLIENALKYLSPKRAGEITIEGKRSPGMVVIDVIDNGRGIAPEDHERIFDLFRRAGSQDQKGEGIGLANVRALAYRLGGTIEVESELDRGARFRLCLPTEFAPQESNS